MVIAPLQQWRVNSGMATVFGPSTSPWGWQIDPGYYQASPQSSSFVGSWPSQRSVESPQSGLKCTLLWLIWTEDTNTPFSSLKLCKVHSDRIKSSQIRLSLYNLYLMTVFVFTFCCLFVTSLCQSHTVTPRTICVHDLKNKCPLVAA